MFSTKTICIDHKGHFTHDNGTETDEIGRMYSVCLFGGNNITVFSNNPQHGNLSHGRLLEVSDGEPCSLGLDVNAQSSGGSTLVLCSGWEPGMDQAAYMLAVYMLRTGSDSTCNAKLIAGQDKWKFSANGDGHAQVCTGKHEDIFDNSITGIIGIIIVGPNMT